MSPIFRSRRANPFVMVLIGVILIIAAIITPFYIAKEATFSCNETDSTKGKCLLLNNGLLNSEIKAIPTDQIVGVNYKEHVYHKRRGGNSITYSIHFKLSDGSDIQFPPSNNVSVAQRDVVMTQANAFMGSGRTTPLHLYLDSRMNGLIFFGVFMLFGLGMIIFSFFQRR